jgi:hypothetical protein
LVLTSQFNQECSKLKGVVLNQFALYLQDIGNLADVLVECNTKKLLPEKIRSMILDMKVAIDEALRQMLVVSLPALKEKRRDQCESRWRISDLLSDV